MKPFAFLLVFIFLFSCKDSPKPSYSKKPILSTKEHPGKRLMKTNCTVCHSVSATEESRIAPPMIAVKNRYLKGNVSKEDFIALMQNWMENPTKENAKMVGAVEKFGLMLS